MYKWVKRRIQFTKLKNMDLDIPVQIVSKRISENIDYMKEVTLESSDIAFRTFFVGVDQKVEAFFVAVEGLYDKTSVHENIIKPLMELKPERNNIHERLNTIDMDLLSLSNIKKEKSLDKSIGMLLKGDPLLFIDGMDHVFVLGARAWEMRGIEEPVTETVVRGPREGFVETLRTNTAMLRRKIHHPRLRIEQTVIGKMSQTDIAIAYLDGIVNPEILKEVRNRLKKINIDAVLESGYIEEFIEDAPLSPFPTVSNTERPDVVAARLLEGRVAIFVEGSATVLMVPYLILESFQSSEDYYSRPFYASLVRSLRMIGFLLSTLAPASYVAFQDFHKEIFPTELLITLAASREGVPFPLFVEVIIMLVSFEWLREAGIRMPRPVGQAVSIVGALVLGDAAVNAGIVGAPTVIVVALTAITGFLVTPLNDVTALLRIFYLIGAGTMGVYGIILVLTFFLLHVASLRSFGIPYASPWFPISWSGWKDFIIRAPLWKLNRRPEALRVMDEVRQGENQKPHPPEHGNKGDRK
jgi:spore germination protein KA